MTLADYLTAGLLEPFEWGVNDCVLFAARWAQLRTGTDYLADVPRWHGKREALRLLQQMGGIEAVLDARLPRIAPNEARDGDLALYGSSLCIVSGPHLVGPSETGLVFVSRMETACAWSL